jgi:hypothetical protein
MADQMTGWGYVSLVVDSFSSRGIKESCDQLMPARPSLSDGMRSFGHWLKYDADAAARSILEMRDFLGLN